MTIKKNPAHIMLIIADNPCSLKYSSNPAYIVNESYATDCSTVAILQWLVC